MQKRSKIWMLTAACAGASLATVGWFFLSFTVVEQSAPHPLVSVSDAGLRPLRPEERVFGLNSPIMLTSIKTANDVFVVKGLWALPEETAVKVQRRLSGEQYVCGADINYCYPIYTGPRTPADARSAEIRKSMGTVVIIKNQPDPGR